MDTGRTDVWRRLLLSWGIVPHPLLGPANRFVGVSCDDGDEKRALGEGKTGVFPA